MVYDFYVEKSRNFSFSITAESANVMTVTGKGKSGNKQGTGSCLKNAKESLSVCSAARSRLPLSYPCFGTRYVTVSDSNANVEASHVARAQHPTFLPKKPKQKWQNQS